MSNRLCKCKQGARELGRAHDTPLVVVASPGTRPAVAKWRVLLQRSGWFEVTDALQPVSTLTVRQIDCAGLAADPDLGQLHVAIPERDARARWTPEKGGRTPDLSVEVAFDQTLRLPRGRYRLTVMDELLQAAVGPLRADVEPGQLARIDVAPQNELVACVLTACHADGSACGGSGAVAVPCIGSRAAAAASGMTPGEARPLPCSHGPLS